MSYCRWSDVDCDVYVYEDVMGGWTTHVARRRWVHPQKIRQPEWDFSSEAKLEQSMIDRKLWMTECDMVDINGPHDGETFNDPTPGECAITLRQLRHEGYHVPQFAIDRLEEDQDEMS